jgi:hypothetical protein
LQLYAHYREKTHNTLRENLLKAQIKIEKVQNNVTMGQKYPKYRQQHPDFQIGDEVLLDMRNMDCGK